MSFSISITCASAGLRSRSDTGCASRAARANCAGFTSAIARAPFASGPISALPSTMPSAAKPGGTLACANALVSHPSRRYSFARDAVSQISIERKCDRFGCG
ncbi:putative lipoprotein [Burkholderia pseudomallei]|nr:putative lipoprotein [Burkholderia pseudomallei]